METKTEVDSIIANAKAPVIEDVNGMPVLQLPPGWSSEHLEKLLPAPLRIKESPVFNEVDSFAEYYRVFAADTGTRLFADDEKREIVVIFDGAAPGLPGHGDHCATLKMLPAPEWKVWVTADGSKKTAVHFTRFLEKNMDYIIEKDGMTGAGLLSMCRDLRVKSTGELNVTENYEDGKRNMVFQTNAEVSGGKEGTHVPFPEFIKVSLRVFKNADRFEFTARLRWDANPNEGVHFIIDLPEVEIVEDDAFTEVLKDVESATGQRVLRGRYS